MLRPLAILIISFGSTGCSADKISSAPISPIAPTPVQAPPATLTGNWLLAGSRVPAVYPLVSASLYVQGSAVTGVTAFAARCTNVGSNGTASGVGLAINGTVANDGSFAGNGTIGSTTPQAASLSLTGNSPLPATPSAWTGMFSLAGNEGSTTAPCDLAQAATFAAIPIAPLTGTYIGTPVNPGLPQPAFGTGAIITLQVVQAHLN